MPNNVHTKWGGTLFGRMPLMIKQFGIMSSSITTIMPNLIELTIFILCQTALYQMVTKRNDCYVNYGQLCQMETLPIFN